MFGYKERIKTHRAQLCCIHSIIDFNKENYNTLIDIKAETIYNKIQKNKEKFEKHGGIFGELCYKTGFENERKDLNKIYKSDICCMIYDLNDIKLIKTDNGNTKLDIVANITGDKSKHLKLLMRENIDKFNFAPRIVISDDGKDFEFITFDIRVSLDNISHKCFYENMRNYDKFKDFIKQYKLNQQNK